MLDWNPSTMSSFCQHRPIKMEPESPDSDLFAVYLKDLMIGDYSK